MVSHGMGMFIQSTFKLSTHDDPSKLSDAFVCLASLVIASTVIHIHWPHIQMVLSH
jgi:hypothetical protein